MLAAGFAAGRTGLSTTAFAQTGVDMPGPVISGSVGGGNQNKIPAEVCGVRSERKGAMKS
jgi:hypothetical protein